MKNQKTKLPPHNHNNSSSNMYQTSCLSSFDAHAQWSQAQAATAPAYDASPHLQQQHQQQHVASMQQQHHHNLHNQQQQHHHQLHSQQHVYNNPFLQGSQHNFGSNQQQMMTSMPTAHESQAVSILPCSSGTSFVNNFSAYAMPCTPTRALSQHAPTPPPPSPAAAVAAAPPPTILPNMGNHLFDNWKAPLASSSPSLSSSSPSPLAPTTHHHHHHPAAINRISSNSSISNSSSNNSTGSSTGSSSSNFDKRNLSLPLLAQNPNHLPSTEFLSNNPNNSRKRKFAALLFEKQQQQQHQQNNSLCLESSIAAPSLYNANNNPLNSVGGAATSTNTTSKLTMDPSEIANFLASELFMQQLVSVNGIQSGVPTLTTPTLTPTTMRSIQETFYELTQEPIQAPYQAGFIPPPLVSSSFLSSSSSVVAAAANTANVVHYNDSISHDYNNDGNDSDSDNSQASWNDQQVNDDISSATTDTSSVAAADSSSFQSGLNGISNNISSINDFSAANVALVAAAAGQSSFHQNTSGSSSANHPTGKTKRNQGGRRPTKNINMSPEEEEKRRVRRERNKLAAARCRKRRVDQTNELLDEVAQLEGKRDNLQKDIEMLTSTKQQLQRLLDRHRPTCQKVRNELMTVNTYGGLILPTNEATDGISRNITGLDSSLASTAGRSGSPVDLKPVILNDQIIDMVPTIKNEPLESAFDSGSSLDHDGPSSPKRAMLGSNNPMIPPPLPAASTLLAAAAHVSLNTPINTSAPVDFSSFDSANATLNTINTLNGLALQRGLKPRPNTLPTIPRNMIQNLTLSVDNKQQPLDINGVAIQTPSTGMFNFDSLMDGGTGLTPVSGPLVPTCSSQNKHPLELTTPTSEPSKLVSL